VKTGPEICPHHRLPILFAVAPFGRQSATVGIGLHIRPEGGVDARLIAAFAAKPLQKVGIQSDRRALFPPRHDHMSILPEGLVGRLRIVDDSDVRLLVVVERTRRRSVVGSELTQKPASAQSPTTTDQFRNRQQPLSLATCLRLPRSSFSKFASHRTGVVPGLFSAALVLFVADITCLSVMPLLTRAYAPRSAGPRHRAR